MGQGLKRSRLSRKLAKSRDASGLTLRELEKRTGIHNALLSQMETGHIREPSFANVVRIARALGLSLSDLAKTVAA